MTSLKVYNVFIDGIDKCGKDIISSYITYLKDFKYLNKSRGIMSMIAYSEKYHRDYDYDLTNEKHTLNVLLDVDYDDWLIRCKIHKEAAINYYEDVAYFDKAYNKLVENNCPVLRFNTSNTTAYQIATSIIEELERLNKENENV